MMSNNILKIAAISDPYFKLIWVEEDSVNEYINLLKGVVRKVRPNHTKSAYSVTNQESRRRSYDFWTGSITQACHHQLRVSAYLAQPA
ncbi:hypothetical protein OUZ56_011692 [Daphnia magna]|uniref:Uncharacterized protein n=1 Tax=Daphnia magna TaxID=35525 RepID=A0ABQ9Z0W9_9CRUS|nr:hypothetical protein OUZ56_011692 [Daphnia magna]